MKNVLVLGANGCLGRHTVSAFFTRGGWNVFGADVHPVHDEISNAVAKERFCQLDGGARLEELQSKLLKAVEGRRFAAVVNVAGGWAGGSVADASTAAATELMLRQSLFTSVAAAHLFSTQGEPDSLLVLTGSAASLDPTPGMLGYGVAKAAVHHLVTSIAADPSKLPKGARVVGLLPTTLDTPANRAGMPDADFSAWTPTTLVAERLVDWALGNSGSDALGVQPKSGDLMVWRGRTLEKAKRT